MKLSKNLYLSEVTKSTTAKRLGISNEPTKEHLVNLQILAKKIFQPIRDYYGCPIYISSGYRSEALNKAIGGSKSSQHCKGQAIDIDRDAYSLPSNGEIFEYIKNNLEFDQLIWEFGSNTNPDWVHVSYNTNGSQRKQILVAYKDSNNRTKYKSYE
jgi:hypothetical protein